MNQSKLEVITGSWRKARENECEWVTIGFGFASDWMKNWREFLSQSCSAANAKPTTFRHSNENRSNELLFFVRIGKNGTLLQPRSRHCGEDGISDIWLMSTLPRWVYFQTLTKEDIFSRPDLLPEPAFLSLKLFSKASRSSGNFRNARKRSLCFHIRLKHEISSSTPMKICPALVPQLKQNKSMRSWWLFYC